MKKTIATSLMILMLTGCSGERMSEMSPAPPERSFQAVNVHTPGVEGATCHLDSARASYSLVTPGSVTVENSAQPLIVSCAKGDHFRGRAMLQPRSMTDMEGHHVAYAYPYVVSVPMGLNELSLRTDLKVY